MIDNAKQKIESAFRWLVDNHWLPLLFSLRTLESYNLKRMLAEIEMSHSASLLNSISHFSTNN